MGSLTDKYQQVKKQTDEKKRLEEEQRQRDADYGRIIENTKFVHMGDCHYVYNNTRYYESTLLMKLDSQQQALFDEAVNLIREDKWQTWKVPEKSEGEIRKLSYTGNGNRLISYNLGEYIKTKWADGSIHACGHKKFFERYYSEYNGFLDFFRRNGAKNAAYNEMQDYVRMIRNAAVGSSSYVRLSYNCKNAILFKDGDVYGIDGHVEKMSGLELENWLVLAVNNVNK